MSGNIKISEDKKAIYTGAIRIFFGFIWLFDAFFKWQPAFQKEYLSLLTNASQNQPHFLSVWFNFWITIVSLNAPLFATLTAIIETYIALSFIFGFALRISYIVSICFALLIWSTAEGFGGAYTAGSTDIGAGIVYAGASFALLVIGRVSGVNRYSIDYFLAKHFSLWKRIAI